MEWNCGNDIAKIGLKKKNLQLVCGNAIAEIGRIFFFFWQLWQSHCQKWEGKKKLFSKSGKELKKSATSTIFLQHFYNKLQVISYY